eukprot:1233193-Ditylum_brightwellii.AAC.1
MVVSKWPCSLSDIAPSAQSEWMPTKSGNSSLAPVALMIWWAHLAKALIEQCATLIACRWIVCPILTFFWV